MKRDSLTDNRPALFGKSEGNIWTDPHIGRQMLAAHLDLASDAAGRRRESVAKIAGFIIEHSKSVCHLLDLGCGPGLYTSIFREHGYRVTGIDFNKASVEYARAQRNDIEYIEGDYFENYPEGRFDAVTMIYCDFGTHCDVDRDRLLRGIYDSLDDGGMFIFDVFSERLAAERHEGRCREYAPSGGFWSAGEYMLLGETFYYPRNHAFACRYDLTTGARQKTFIVWDRYYTEDEITAVLRRAGFRNVTIHRNLLENNNFT